ncbi:MAG: 50S ribosomal protein L9 [Verrucomicrobia bacterium]|jgi:large subunit ribosomal protein L9|nr:50S ribosomal protein L9 [Verrucomicrobiota bacterium]
MKYQLLLLEDLVNYGRKGDLVQVAPGFARNCLLPQGKALLASYATVKMREKLKQEREAEAVRDRALSEKLAGEINGQMFETVVKVDPDGHMYGSVTTADIADILFNKGFTVNKKYIALIHPIRALGSYEITLKLPEGIEASVGLAVKPDRELKKKEKSDKEEKKLEEQNALGKEAEGKS